MGCLNTRPAMYTMDGSPLVDTRYVRDWTASRMTTPDGQAARKSGATHRRQRPENLQRPAPSLDEPGLGSPPQTPTMNESALVQESRHRRAAAMLRRVLRKVALVTNPNNAGRMSEYWSRQLPKQREALSLFGNCSKTALQLGELLSANAVNLDNAYLVNAVFGCLLDHRFSAAELTNADTHRNIFDALSRHSTECPIYPSLCFNGLLLLVKMCRVSHSHTVADMAGHSVIDVDRMFSPRNVDDPARHTYAAAVARAVEFFVVNSEIFERLMRCYAEERHRRHKTFKTKSSKKRKTVIAGNGKTVEQARMVKSTSKTIPGQTPRTDALRRMCGSVFFERKRRNLPSKKEQFCSELVRKERQAILIVDDISPLLTCMATLMLPIPIRPTDAFGRAGEGEEGKRQEDEEKKKEGEDEECRQGDGLETIKEHRLGDILEQRDPENERLLLHLMLQCIDEITLMSPSKTGFKRALLSDLSCIELVNLLCTSVEAAKMSQFWRSRPALMTACWCLLCMIEDATGKQFGRLVERQNDQAISCWDQLVQWKTRNPVSSTCLFRQNGDSEKNKLLSAATAPSGCGQSSARLSSPRLSTPHRSPSPTTKKGLLSLRAFEGLQQELLHVSATARSPSSEMQLSQNVLDRTLLHSLSVIEDQYSTADNKLEVARFMLDVLATKQAYRRGMRASEHWMAVESVLTWARFNDVLLLTQNQSNGTWETLDGMRSAGLHRLDLPVTLISEEQKTMDNKTTVSLQEPRVSVYTCTVPYDDGADLETNNGNENEEGNVNDTFLEIIIKMGHLDRECRRIIKASDPELSSARLLPLTNSWSEALRCGGDAIARASLNGPIGVIDIIDFHSGNPFILERGSTLLASDGCSASTLVAAGAVEVIARSLRKMPTMHPFYLSAAIKASGIIARAFDGASEETASRLLASESDITLSDLVAWMDSNADVCMPPLPRGNYSSGMGIWVLVLRSRLAVSLQIAIVDAIGSETVIGVVPYGAVLSLLEMKGEWVHVEYLPGREKSGSSSICEGDDPLQQKEDEAIRGWFAHRSLRSSFLTLLPG